MRLISFFAVPNYWGSLREKLLIKNQGIERWLNALNFQSIDCLFVLYQTIKINRQMKPKITLSIFQLPLHSHRSVSGISSLLLRLTKYCVSFFKQKKTFHKFPRFFSRLKIYYVRYWINFFRLLKKERFAFLVLVIAIFLLAYFVARWGLEVNNFFCK